MGFTYGKRELMQDLQRVFAKHNVQSIKVNKPGTLFKIESDGSMKVEVGATITAFDCKPGEKPVNKFRVVNGGNQKKQ
ncbi:MULTISPECIES: hypothetical protein [Halobacillus]|uniref:Uncharacterized protein n=1 Tax=Halobacillus halophilus (strain ATCC 35676 / DSM 2266 / JCM 20832 / KCTC 3685 / LMG 17431 / NBRC 102448 / NCIMB 2269) TaxID=866895 RepID=I0JL76_HALH3|nr:hypothetical protein [Halobacillus halophilus]ASF39020.1 hypothetical protein CEH05_07795 [Halobacillus halophilus]CCG44896.1 hypothetical protein HBHAL_2550 [Halobacillus halophilus DSM 2266]